MSTIFDVDAVDEFDSLLKIYKISSSDINNVPLLRKIGSKNKHTIISTGASNIKEIKFAIKNLNLPKKKICIMHCVLNYQCKFVCRLIIVICAATPGGWFFLFLTEADWEHH